MTTTETAKDIKDLKDIKEKIDLGLLEEDDEFEEFQAEGRYFCDAEEMSLKKSPILTSQSDSSSIRPFHSAQQTGKRKTVTRICRSGRITGTTMTWRTISLHN